MGRTAITAYLLQIERLQGYGFSPVGLKFAEGTEGPVVKQHHVALRRDARVIASSWPVWLGHVEQCRGAGDGAWRSRSRRRQSQRKQRIRITPAPDRCRRNENPPRAQRRDQHEVVVGEKKFVVVQVLGISFEDERTWLELIRQEDGVTGYVANWRCILCKKWRAPPIENHSSIDGVFKPLVSESEPRYRCSP